MKDEEIAEEYTTKNGFGSDCNNLTSYEANKEIEQAFLAGLKAGKPQWHDLRKNPNDLPDTERDVWVKREDEENCQLDNYYNDDEYVGWRTEQWDREYYKRKGDIGYPSSVIAWCEAPKWEE